MPTPSVSAKFTRRSSSTKTAGTRIFGERLPSIATFHVGILASTGAEAPFPRSDYHYPLKCSLSASSSTSWPWNFSPSIKIGKAVKIGERLPRAGR